jgi:hypothetical protein
MHPGNEQLHAWIVDGHWGTTMLLQGDLWLTAIFNKHSGDLQAVHFF